MCVYIYIYIYMRGVKKPCTSVVYCVHIDMFEGVLFSLCSARILQGSRKRSRKQNLCPCMSCRYVCMN